MTLPGQSLQLDDTEAIGLLTKTKVIVKKSKVESRTFDLAEVDEFTVDQAKITGWLNTAKKFLVLVFYPLAVLGSFFSRIIQALIYAAIGLLFALRCEATLSYSATLRLAVVAITPCIIVKTVLGVAGVHLPLAGLWYFLGALGYLFFGVKACSGADEPLALQANVSSEGPTTQG